MACIFSYKPKAKDSPLIEMLIGDDQWFNVGRLGVNWGHLLEIRSLDRFGLVGDFVTPNMVRTYGIEWDIRLEIAGEELKWETSFGYGGGLPVKLMNGDGSGGRVQEPQGPGPQFATPNTAYDEEGPAEWERKGNMNGMAPPRYDGEETRMTKEKCSTVP